MFSLHMHNPLRFKYPHKRETVSSSYLNALQSEVVRYVHYCVTDLRSTKCTEASLNGGSRYLKGSSIRRFSTMGFNSKSAKGPLNTFKPRPFVQKKAPTGLPCPSLGQLSSLLVLAAMSAWVPVSLALNLGHTHIQSKQGEPLRASIEIHSAAPEELVGLGVQLFSQKDYQALGLNWEKSLANTGLYLTTTKDGRLFVSIQGQEPVEQSFVELFFEMHWNSGQVNKQVGLLLDPLQTQVSSPSRQDSTDKIILVTRGDNASQLIKPYLAEDISLDQMLLALVQTNPKSFVNGNVNRLRAGSTLQIPKRDLALRLSTEAAQSQVKAQNHDFNLYRQALIGKIKNSKAKGPKAQANASTGLVHEPKKSSSSNKDQLTLSKPNAPSAGSLEALSKERAEKEQAQKLKEMQDNIKELQALSQKDSSFGFAKGWQAVLDASTELWQQSSGWVYGKWPGLQNYAQWPLAPVITGLVFAFFVLFSIWSLQRKRQSDPAPNAKDSFEPPSWRDEDNTVKTSPVFGDPFDHSLKTQGERPLDGAHASSQEHARSPSHLSAQDLMAQQVHNKDDHNTMGPILEDDRVKLAEDLWEIGQHHTAYAIAQEVLQQSTGREFERARLWLESHAV